MVTPFFCYYRVNKMSCQYGFYKKTETNRPKLYCSITNDLCVYSKLCLKVNKYIYNDKSEECMIRKENNKKSIPNGAYYVRFVKNGYAYVELGDTVIKVKCDNLDNIINYIYIQQNEDGTYVGSLTPFVSISEPKKITKKRKNKVENNNSENEV